MIERRILFPIAVLALLAACGSSATVPSPTTAPPAPAPSSSPSPSATASASVSDPLEGTQAVAFTTEDGIAIEGRLFGSGTVGVVLVHGTFEIGQASWFAFARTLSDEGYRVLTINLRGFCPGGVNGCSGGTRNPPETWNDVAAAAAYLRANGVERIFLMGASLGARSCFWAASRPEVEVAGVIGISTPLSAVAPYSPAYDFTTAVIAAIAEPKLFVAGERDEDYAAQAQTLYAWSTEPRHIAIVPSAAHGPDLLQLPGPASQAVFDFLVRYREPT